MAHGGGSEAIAPTKTSEAKTDCPDEGPLGCSRGLPRHLRLRGDPGNVAADAIYFSASFEVTVFESFSRLSENL
jgi:hypothetical protein